MKKRNLLLSVFLSISVFITGLWISPVYASTTNQDPSLSPTASVSASSIGLKLVHLEKYSSNSVYYWVTANSRDGISSSMTAKIVLQKSNAGTWVDKETITRTEYNVGRIDFDGTISVSSYGAGSYRIKVTFSDVYNGMTSTVGPYNSVTVVI